MSFGAALPKAIDGVGVDGAVVEAGSLANALGAVGVPKLFAWAGLTGLAGLVVGVAIVGCSAVFGSGVPTAGGVMPAVG